MLMMPERICVVYLARDKTIVREKEREREREREREIITSDVRQY